MNLLPRKAHRVRRWPLFYLFPLSIFLISTGFALPAASQTKLKIRVPDGTSTRATITIQNNCPEPHIFRVSLTEKVEYVRFQERAEAISVPGSSTKKLGIIFNAADLNEKVTYRGTIQSECTDCVAAAKCSINRLVVPYQIKVTEPPVPTTQAQLASRYRKTLANELAKSQAAQTPDAREMLDKILDQGAKVAIETGNKKKIEESFKNVKKLARALVEYGEKPGQRPPGTSFAARSRWNAPVAITPESVRRALATLCPLFPFCR